MRPEALRSWHAPALPLAVLACCALAAGLWQWRQGRPVEVADAPAGKLECVSYSPYHTSGQTPFLAGTVISEAQIDADLAVLAQRFSCVRTYSVDQGLSAVPRLAARHGMQTLMGIWISRDPVANEKEIALAVRTAHETVATHPGAIRAVIVGNEVLLRRELPGSALRDYIMRVAAATGLPVTYADVWEFWLKNPDIAPAVSFVTVHMLPYWEDKPIPVPDAVAHVLRAYDGVQHSFPGKAILIGETGWPSRGRQREGARPGRVEQARFLREFLAAAQARGIPYNLVEAYDQPWKRALEGTVGGYWGVYDGAGTEKFPLQGPLAEDPHWQRGLLAGGAGAALALVLLLALRANLRGLAAGACGGFAAGVVYWRQYAQWMTASRDALEQTVTGGCSVLSLFAAILLITALARPAANPPARAPEMRTLAWLRPLILFGAAVTGLLLALDSRYRDFPLALYAVPAVGYALLALASPMPGGREEKTLAALLLAETAFILCNEGLHNLQAWAWGALCLLLATAVYACDGTRASATSASTVPTADTSAL